MKESERIVKVYEEILTECGKAIECLFDHTKLVNYKMTRKEWNKLFAKLNRIRKKYGYPIYDKNGKEKNEDY